MTIKLSPIKVGRLLRLYLQGFIQVAIAEKLKVNQGTVSLYVNEFTAMVDEEGLEATAKEYGIMDIVKELHSLGAELKKSHLTVEDAKVGLKAAMSFEECDVPPDDYKEVVATCLEMHNEDFLNAAMELHKIEKSTGMSYKEILAKASDCQMKLEQAKKHLSATHEDYSQLKQKLNKIQQQEVKAENQLKEKLDQLGLNFSRLSKIENLALALKKAGITNVQLDAYLKLQELLNNAGIPINVLVEIVYAVQGSPGADGGKSLLEKIKEHNGLEVSISSLKQEEQALTQKVAGLEEKAKIKGELQTQVTNLQVQKKEREGEISVLTIQYKQLSDAVATLKTQEAQLVKQADALETGIEEKRKHVQQLDLEIENKQKKVVDFADIEAKREILLHELAEAEESIKNITFERNIVKAFMGLVQKQSMAELESLYSSMPSMIEKVKKNEYSPALIINFVLRTLGPQTHVLKCESCGIRFTVDKAPTGFEYHCPSGDYGHKTLIEMPSVEVLKSILAPKKITGTIVVKNEPEDGKTA